VRWLLSGSSRLDLGVWKSYTYHCTKWRMHLFLIGVVRHSQNVGTMFSRCFPFSTHHQFNFSSPLFRSPVREVASRYNGMMRFENWRACRLQPSQVLVRKPNVPQPWHARRCLPQIDGLRQARIGFLTIEAKREARTDRSRARLLKKTTKLYGAVSSCSKLSFAATLTSSLPASPQHELTFKF
jgi:hypothetical protein